MIIYVYGYGYVCVLGLCFMLAIAIVPLPYCLKRFAYYYSVPYVSWNSTNTMSCVLMAHGLVQVVVV